jgi:hypothetical protein
MSDEPERESPDSPTNRSDSAHSEEDRADVLRRLLFLDDDPRRAETFLSENPQAVWVQTVPECLACLVDTWDEVHLDHDLGGETFVDMEKNDCGMEVIRWLCKEPRNHLRQSRFFIHTHNSIAGLLMVLQMRSSGYKAEFRPFGLDLAQLLPGDDDEPMLDGEPLPDTHSPTSAESDHALRTALRRWIGRLMGYWRSKLIILL